MEKSNKYWYAILILAFVVWGTQHPPLKVLSADISPSLLSFVRFFIAGLVLLPFVFRNRVKVEKKDLAIISFLGFIGIFLYGILGITGVNLSTATNNAILVNSWPLIALLLAPLVIKEKVTVKQALGVLIGFIGVVLIINNGIALGNLIESEFFSGNVLILLTAACIAVYSTFNKKYIQKYGGLEVTFYAVVAGTMFLLASSLVSGDIFAINQISFNSFLLLLWVAVPTTALTWVIWFKSIDRIGLVKTSSFFLLIPVSGIATSALFLNEEITIFTIIGTLLILLGIYIVQKKM